MDCKIQNMVFQLIEEHSLEDLRGMSKDMKGILSIMSIAIPSGDEAQQKHEKFRLMDRLIDMAIAYIEESSSLEA